MTSEGSESITASINTKSGYFENVSASTTKKRKRPSDSIDDVEACISTFLKKVPEIAKSFDIIDVLGDGTFSYVFHGRPKNTSVSTSYALKYIIPTSASWRITNEIKYLKRLGGKHHVCDIKSIIRCHDNVVLILPYFKTTRFVKVVQDSNQLEIQRYLKALFEALAHVHYHNVIHRDVKPSNFLYDRESSKFLLVDFGLAEDVRNEVDKENRHSSNNSSGTKKSKNEKTEFALLHKISKSQKVSILKDRSPRIVDKKKSVNLNSKNKTDSPKSSRSKSKLLECSHPFNEICNTCLMKPVQEASRAGTPGFRSPEMLMKHPGQTTAVDIWAAGVIFLSLLSGRYPFFKAGDDLTSLCQIVTLLGSDAIVNAAKSIGKNMTLSKEIIGYEIKIMCNKLRESGHISLCQICSENNAANDRTKMCPLQPIVSPAFDLLSRCLDPNPYSRITADQALKHEFFISLPPPPLMRKF